MMLTPPINRLRGFTLLESLVAVAILALAIAGPLYAASRSIIAAQLSRDKLTASYLAQEGIEYVRQVRDNSYIAAYRTNRTTASDSSWTPFVNQQISRCPSARGCTLDDPWSSSSVLTTCASSGCTALYLNAAKQYTQKSITGGIANTVTPFIRTIKVEAVSGTANEVSVTSDVTWIFHGTPYHVTITDHLTPFLP